MYNVRGYNFSSKIHYLPSRQKTLLLNVQPLLLAVSLAVAWEILRNIWSGVLSKLVALTGFLYYNPNINGYKWDFKMTHCAILA